MTEPEMFTCPDCERVVPLDDDGYAICWGKPDHDHGKRRLAWPCGICGKTIRMAEICKDCADESDIDAMTPVWGR